MIKNVQMLRGIAAILVVICHSTGQWGPHPDLRHYWFILGQSGVDLFFVISGFIISSVAVKNAEATPSPKGAWLFAFNRATRIFPIYWVALAAAFFTSWAVFGDPFEGSKLPLWKVLTLQAPSQVLAVSWTLVFEVFFYEVMLLALLCSGRLFRTVLLWGTTAYAVTILWMVFTSPAGVPFWANSIILEFAFGIGIYFLVSSKRKVPQPLAIGLVVAGVIALAVSPPYLSMLPNIYTARAAWFGLPSALILFGFINIERTWQAPWWAVALGDASYSIYLFHGVAVHKMAMLHFAPYPSLIAGLVTIIALTALGVAAYYLFEKPIMGAAASLRTWLFLPDRLAAPAEYVPAIARPE